MRCVGNESSADCKVPHPMSIDRCVGNESSADCNGASSNEH